MARYDSDIERRLAKLNQYVKTLSTDGGGGTTYKISDYERDGDIVYGGFAVPGDASQWVVKRGDESVEGVVTVYYASVDNNPGILNYTTAWSNKETLVYELVKDVVL